MVFLSVEAFHHFVCGGFSDENEQEHPPGFSSLADCFMNWSSMPMSVSVPDSVPALAPTAALSKGGTSVLKIVSEADDELVVVLLGQVAVCIPLGLFNAIPDG